MIFDISITQYRATLIYERDFITCILLAMMVATKLIYNEYA